MSSITPLNQMQKTSFNLGWNDRQSSPNAMKLNKMTPNAYVLNIKLILYINNIPFIHKPSVVYLSIWIHQHYIDSQQGSGEMALFLHCLTFLHEIFWYFDLRVFWNLNTWIIIHSYINHNYFTYPFESINITLVHNKVVGKWHCFFIV